MNNKIFQILDRRSFIKLSGGSAIAASILASCDDSETDAIVNVGEGDIGLLNYFYVLEQLQAEFYKLVAEDALFTTTFSQDEQAVFTDIRDHEIIHRDYVKNALGIDAIEAIEFNFKGVVFSNRTQVLLLAQDLEDMSLAAYNYAGKLLTDTNLLIVVSKIVSVEARHSASVRDLQSPRSANFAGDDVVDESGLDRALSPQEAMEIASKYIATKINVNNLPTT